MNVEQSNNNDNKNELINVEISQDIIINKPQEKENNEINKLIIKNDGMIKQEKEEKEKLNIITKYSNLEPSLFSDEYILDY